VQRYHEQAISALARSNEGGAPATREVSEKIVLLRIPARLRLIRDRYRQSAATSIRIVPLLVQWPQIMTPKHNIQHREGAMAALINLSDVK